MLVCRALAGGHGRPRADRGHALLAVALLTTAYGVTDEYHQSFVPGRHVRPRGRGLKDLGGAVVAAWLYRRVAAPRRRSPEEGLAMSATCASPWSRATASASRSPRRRCAVLEAVAAASERRRPPDQHFDWGADHYLKTGVTLPADALAELPEDFDAILLGAMGDPRVPDNRHAADILLGLRFRLDLYVNYRPVPPLPREALPAQGRDARRTSTSSSSARTPRAST